MKWVPDKTGRFTLRPHYDPDELDQECEQALSSFLQKQHGKVEFPITTDDLTVLIETRAKLDVYADLSEEGTDVEGVTEFVQGHRPLVRISNALHASNMENRLRTTLTHEFGHIHFHQFLFETESRPGSLFEDPTAAPPTVATNKCKRESIVGAPVADWMEWQAGYACGALLMPSGTLTDFVKRFRKDNGLELVTIAAPSDAGIRLIEAVARSFHTSRDASRVRLLQKRFVSDVSVGAGLF